MSTLSTRLSLPAPVQTEKFCRGSETRMVLSSMCLCIRGGSWTVLLFFPSFFKVYWHPEFSVTVDLGEGVRQCGKGRVCALPSAWQAKLPILELRPYHYPKLQPGTVRTPWQRERLFYPSFARSSTQEKPAHAQKNARLLVKFIQLSVAIKVNGSSGDTWAACAVLFRKAGLDPNLNLFIWQVSPPPATGVTMNIYVIRNTHSSSCQNKSPAAESMAWRSACLSSEPGVHARRLRCHGSVRQVLQGECWDFSRWRAPWREPS